MQQATGGRRAVEWTKAIALEKNEKTVSLSGVDMEGLARIYDEMDCLISAGREGFGLPYLEARVCGCHLILPKYSAHYSMDYPEAETYVCQWTKPDPNAPDVLDIVPSPSEICKSMINICNTMRQTGGPKELPQNMADALKWESIARILYRKILEHGQSKKRIQRAETTVIISMDYDKIGPFKDDWIAIVMPRSTGDVMLTTAVAKALRDKHPGCRLEFITSKEYFPLVLNCPWIDNVSEYNPELHGKYDVMHKLYAAFYTPFHRTQLSGNWVQGGHGRRLAEVYADDCGVPLGTDYWCLIDEKFVDRFTALSTGEYLTIHVGSGIGEQSARAYHRWNEVVAGLAGKKVVQVGTTMDFPVHGTIDMRGNTTYSQLAGLIHKAKAHVGIDSFPMHMAAIIGTPSIIAWGNTFPHATGPDPRLPGAMYQIEPPSRHGCFRPCHYTKCPIDAANPCVNLIDPKDIVSLIKAVVKW
jgi:hypothetical protein